ncbi:MAG: DUF4339 domain-containing protein [Pirellulaceae bacterium]|nr:DUF4339 domain-containing protein [Pirellulaceae bacterium]
MEDRYYVRFKGRVLGPMSGDKTKELVRRGQITRVHELSPDGIEWRKAEEFTEFYPKKPIVQVVTEAVTEQQKPKQAEAIEWFVHMDGQNQGPVEESSIRLWINSGRVTPDSLVWKDGMAEWLAAEIVCPQWFAGRAANVGSNTSAKTVNGSDSLEAICTELRRQTFWIYSTSIVGLFACGCQILWWLFVLISQIVAPPDNSQAVVVGLIGTFIGAIFSGLGMFCSVQLLRYANSVAVLKHAPTDQNTLVAARRLSGVWLFVGIYVFTTIVFFSILGLLIYVGTLRSLYLISN